MEGAGGRSKEAVRKSVRTYGVKVMDQASLPLNENKDVESQESIKRYTKKSFRSEHRLRKASCKTFMQRIPYATLLATVVCFLGTLISAIAWKRSENLTEALLAETDNINLTNNLLSYGTGFMILDCVSAAIGMLILIIGFLATGDTRNVAYRSWKARMGGRICCAVLMGFSLVLLAIWSVIFYLSGYFIAMTLEVKYLCELRNQFPPEHKCLLLTVMSVIFGFKIPIKVCDPQGLKFLCKDFAEGSLSPYVILSFGIFFMMAGFVLYLICLSANYARIRSEGKFREINELQGLEEDLNRSKDRF